LDLSALSANLREVEERLTRKGQRLVQIERELEEARTERAMVEERARLLDAELLAAHEAKGAVQAQFDDLKRASDAEISQLKRTLEVNADESRRSSEAREATQHLLATREGELQAQLA